MKMNLKLVLGLSATAILAIAGCSITPKSGVSKSNQEYRQAIKGAPDWVYGDLNKIAKSQGKEYSGVFLGRAEEKIIDGNVEFATDTAKTKAKADLAENLKSQLKKELKEDISANESHLSQTTTRHIEQAVDKELVATKMLARYVGKDRVFVLVGLDREIMQKVRDELGMNKKKK
ncbi:LPP20 family lipoprotein [Helicobacter cetorum]|uniref:Membrane-associated lipoprotein n=1 Tax=Helicobacter cetorum (strain ATCC BAA-429 / MIT 00-7128) TaxID=182217 RepID=I0ENT9_HELC0|nr:LPP20 family lipoprotein [Helicobacter cetorum]AFI04608.1 Membrane-associated lipoprotein [Helicobacter cetorum MIT 00-7128]